MSRAEMSLKSCTTVPSGFFRVFFLSMKLEFSMKFTMEINSCSSDQDLARILRGVADRVGNPDMDPDTRYPVIDINGNSVGYFEVETDPDQGLVEYYAAFQREDGEFEIVREFCAHNDLHAEVLAEEWYPGQEWYLLDERKQNINGG